MKGLENVVCDYLEFRALSKDALSDELRRKIGTRLEQLKLLRDTIDELSDDALELAMVAKRDCLLHLGLCEMVLGLISETSQKVSHECKILLDEGVDLSLLVDVCESRQGLKGLFLLPGDWRNFLNQK